MEGNKIDVRNSISAFRRKLIDDQQFRQTFAADPEGTLRTIGIDVPSGANIAPISATELDARVDRLKEALGEDISALYDDTDFDEMARDPQKVLRLQEILNIARKQPGELAELELEAVAGGRKEKPGDVYTISAFSTLDW